MTCGPHGSPWRQWPLTSNEMGRERVENGVNYATEWKDELYNTTEQKDRLYLDYTTHNQSIVCTQIARNGEIIHFFFGQLLNILSWVFKKSKALRKIITHKWIYCSCANKRCFILNSKRITMSFGESRGNVGVRYYFFFNFMMVHINQ